MAERGGLHVDGLQQTIRSLQRLGVEVADLKAVFAPAAEEVRERAVREAPYRADDGQRRVHRHLRDTVRATKRKNGAMIMAGGRGARHASLVMYGSIHNPRPDPFLRRAASQVDVGGMVMTELNALLRREGLT
jgi:hypothetical protein